MATIFNAFAQGVQLGTAQREAREMAERRALEQQREAKLNALSGQAFGAADPAQVNQLAQTAAALGGAPAGAQIQAISQGQNELQNQRRTQMFETIARRVASVAQLPEGPEREAAWAAGVNEIVTDPAQRDQLLALGSAQGIPAVASQIAPVGAILQRLGYTPPDTENRTQVISPGSVVFDPVTRTEVYRNPIQQRPSAVRPTLIPMSDGTARSGFFDPNSRQYFFADGTPVAGGGGSFAPDSAPPMDAGMPAGEPMSFEEANAIAEQEDIAAGGMPPEQYQQRLNELMGGGAPQVVANLPPLADVGGGTPPPPVSGGNAPAAGVRPAQARASDRPTEGERKAAGFFERMQNAEGILSRLEQSGYDPTNIRDRVAGDRGVVGNYAITQEGQQYRQAADNWIRANLRRESGAVIGADEMEAEYRNYFPQPGDTPEVVEQKRQNRIILQNNLRREGERALGQPAAAPAEAAPSGEVRRIGSFTVRRVGQ